MRNLIHTVKGIVQEVEREIAGVMGISLKDAIQDGLLELKAYGGTEQNGTPTPTTPVDIVCNNGVLKYGVCSTNIFDVTTMDTGRGWYISNGVIGDATPNRTIVINCKPNTKYSWWHCNGAGGSRAFTLDTDTISVGMTASWLTGASPTYKAQNVVTTVTTSASAKKLYICAGRTDTNISRSFDEQLADFMVVEGEVTTALPYEPYKLGLYVDGTTETIEDELGNTATAEMLLKVGDYADVQSIIDGVVTRNIGVKVFDGTENFSKLTSGAFRVSLTTKADKNIELICTHYLGVAPSLSTLNQPDLSIKSNATNINTLYIKDLQYDTEAQLQAYLTSQYNAGTPVILIYKLETPTTESVAGQTMNIQAGDGDIEITQASINTLELSAKYKALPN